MVILKSLLILKNISWNNKSPVKNYLAIKLLFQVEWFKEIKEFWIFRKIPNINSGLYEYCCEEIEVLIVFNGVTF